MNPDTGADTVRSKADMADNEGRRYGAIPPQREALEAEAEVLRHWDENDVFRRSIDERPEDRNFVERHRPLVTVATTSPEWKEVKVFHSNGLPMVWVYRRTGGE